MTASSESIALSPEPEAVDERRARRVRSFAVSRRRAIQRLAVQNVAFEDLADSFPALLFALATDFGTAATRSNALSLVARGEPLRATAHALGLPWWLRRLPAEAFDEPLGDVPADPAFAQRIIAFIPEDRVASRFWLSAVLYGHRACHSEYALWVASWIARQRCLLSMPIGGASMRMLAAWAWHASQQQAPAHRLLRRPWTCAMSHRRAIDELQAWTQRIALAQLLDCQKLASSPGDGSALGYEFVGLRSAEDYIGESATMDNCLDQFTNRILQQYSRVYSIRRNGRVVADVEIGLHPEEQRILAIRQLRGPRNRRASAEVWQATYAWLGSQPLRLLQAQDYRPDAFELRMAAKRIWQPYLDAIAGHTQDVEAFRELVLGSRNECLVLKRKRRKREAPAGM